MPEERVNDTRPANIVDLPNEVLAKIFFAGTEIWKNIRPQGFPFPVLVSDVCSHWRLLAQSTPNLWAFVIPPLHKDEDTCLSQTSKWLERSGALLVSVVLDGRTASPSRTAKETTLLICKTLALLLEKADSRVRRLDIWAYDSFAVRNSLSGLFNTPHLQQLSLCFHDHPGIPSSFGNTERTWDDWALSLSSLTKLRVLGVITPCIPNLTSLTAHNFRMSYHDVHALFETSPHLTNLVFDGLVPIMPPIPAERTRIQANSLRSIAVKSNGMKDPSSIYIFQLLIIPNLTYLELEGTLSISSIFGSSISSSKIETLRVSHYPQFSFLSNPGKDEDIRMFQSFSSLRHLQLIQAPTMGFLSLSKSDHPVRTRTRTRSIHLPKASIFTRPTMDPLARPRQYEHGTLVTEVHLPSERQSVPWRELRGITLDALLATDLACLCEFVAHHGKLESVELSKPAMRHLSESLRRRGDKVFPIPWRVSSRDVGEDGATKDVKEWLAGLSHSFI
ncbi:hypothetical protein BDZ97DRAFT_1386431 [Flammula alnicola]|nr:hypothetical protein BDZ97DRAFT_1386431 [Flammula alnicola]